MQTSNSFHQP